MVRLPLLVVLAIQVAVVVAAFAAVISVFSVQQRNEFEASLFTRLRLQHSSSLQSIVSPILERATMFDRFIDSYTNGKNGNKQFTAPADEAQMTTLQRAQDFYDHFYIMAANDPFVSLISFGNLSSTRWEPYYTVTRTQEEYNQGVLLPNGQRVIPRSWGLNRTSIWNLWALDKVKLVSIQDETAKVCMSFSGYPSIRYPCVSPAFPVSQALNTATTVGSGIEFRREHLWGTPKIVDDSSTNTQSTFFAYNRQLYYDTMPDNFINFGLSFALPYVSPLVKNNTAHASSRAALFSAYYSIALNKWTNYLVTGVLDFPLLEQAIVNITGDVLDGTWEGGDMPDMILNAAYFLALSLLEPNTTNSIAAEMKHGGTKYIVSASRHADSTRAFNWLYVEYTPRKVFFEDSDRTRLAGILIGVFGGLVVLCVCVLIWLAVSLPLKDLAHNMDLAADLRNAEVQHGSPILSELHDVGSTFKEMNARLLAALPFLPQSLLARRGTSDDEEDLGNESMDGEDDESTLKDRPTARVRSGVARTADSSSIVGSGDDSSSPQARNASCNQSTVGGLRHTNRTTISSESNTQYNTKQRLNGGRAKGAAPPVGLHHREMELRRVGVLAVNVLSFHNVLLNNTNQAANVSTSSASMIYSLHACIARIVEQAVSEERGIVDLFHGDRFVCGFNTARMCGNTARNGSQAAVKIWGRFLAQDALTKAFPSGLSMGLGVGRAAVGNHGTDTMQRLATIGPAYTEAAKLQEVMARRILHFATTPHGGTPPPGPNPLIAGRCLVMGRTIQEIETSARDNDGGGVLCQIVGAVESSHFLPAAVHRDIALQQTFAHARNTSVMRTVLPEGLDGPLSSVPTAFEHRPTTILVAAVCAASDLHAGGGDRGKEEWLYEMNAATRRNVFGECNAALSNLWVRGAVEYDGPTPLMKLDHTTSQPSVVVDSETVVAPLQAPATMWPEHVRSIFSHAKSAESAMVMFTH